MQVCEKDSGLEGDYEAAEYEYPAEVEMSND